MLLSHILLCMFQGGPTRMLPCPPDEDGDNNKNNNSDNNLGRKLLRTPHVYVYSCYI